MKNFFSSLILILLLKGSSVYSQSFLAAYKEMLSSQKERKQIRNYIKPHIIELDSIFKSHKMRTGFDFNQADSLFFIYDIPTESPFIGDVTIWSGKDTISYKQDVESSKPFQYKRKIIYTTSNPHEKEKDSLIALVSKRDFLTISHLGDNQSINDGSYVFIYVAYKTQTGYYKFEKCFPPKFIIW